MVTLDVRPKGVLDWHNSQSTRVPSTWPGFDSRTRRHVLSLLCLALFREVSVRVLQFPPLINKKTDKIVWFNLLPSLFRCSVGRKPVLVGFVDRRFSLTPYFWLAWLKSPPPMGGD